MRYRIREEITKNKRLSVALSDKDHQLLKVLSADQGITMSSFVFRALRHYLDFMKCEEKFERNSSDKEG